MPEFEYQVRIVPRGNGAGSGDLPGFLDMLRHDRCLITDWGRDGDGFIVTFVTERPITERWASFRLFPKRTAIHTTFSTPRKGTD